MAWKFETLGNAIVQVFADDRPVLVTDPWLTGTAYFGSWAIERPLSARQQANACNSPYVWISHGHPDHLHPDSLKLLDKERVTILLPDHYHPEIAEFLAGEGFRTRVLPHKQWVRLEPGLRVLCVANENMDAILAIEAGDALVLNKNDSPFCGEDRFFRALMQSYRKSYLLALCAIDADMLNLYDEWMRPIAGPPQERKPGAIWAASKICDYLGAGSFCCSSSQHIYVRADSAWANPYRITAEDMRRHWCAKATRLILPYATVNLEDGSFVINAPEPGCEASAPTETTGDDAWAEPLSEAEWQRVEAFLRKFETLKTNVDFVAFTVAGKTRAFALTPRGATAEARGVNFHVPRRSLLETVDSGYFDDLLIGNFMKTQLFNMTLYPDFTPTIAKLGGNAKVYTPSDLRQFRRHFFRRSPTAYWAWRWQRTRDFRLMPAAKSALRRVGLIGVAKGVYRKVVGGPKAA